MKMHGLLGYHVKMSEIMRVNEHNLKAFRKHLNDFSNTVLKWTFTVVIR